MPSRNPGVITQDWEPVAIHQSRPKGQDLRDPKAVNQARRSFPLVHVSQILCRSFPLVHVSQILSRSPKAVNQARRSFPIVHDSDILSRSPTMPSRNPGVITQDWEPVVIHKSRAKGEDLRDPKAVNQALRSGAPIQTIKKFDAGSNKKAAPVVSVKKLEEGTEPAALERVSTDVRQAIQKARLAKKLSQADLAKRINERPQVVQEYENGKAVQNQAVLSKMERVLEVKLRGKVGKQK